jgi:uncharacterized membrane protein YgdD (TMEM256/DUF423 family)
MKKYNKYIWAGGILTLIGMFTLEYSRPLGCVIIVAGWYCLHIKGLNQRFKAGK